MEMDRRRALLGAVSMVTSALSPGLAHAQSGKMVRIGFLNSGRAGTAFDTFPIFRDGLRNFGYVEGQNVVFEARFGEGQVDLLPRLAAELLSLNLDVIAVSSAVALRALRQAGASVPIVFAVAPSPAAVVEMGLVASVERPGGNVTGISSFDPNQASKSFALLKEIIPKLETVAILSDQDIPRSTADAGWNPYERSYDTAARSQGLRSLMLRIKGPTPDVEGAFAAMMAEKVQALRVMEVPVPLLHLNKIADLAKARRLPTMLPGGYPNSGGMISYGTSIFDAVREMPGYVDRILKGAKPGEMPITIGTGGELVINLSVAHELGVTIPPDVLKRANRIL